MEVKEMTIADVLKTPAFWLFPIWKTPAEKPE
jgi:hypothetical protein